MSLPKFKCPNQHCNYQNNVQCAEGEMDVKDCKYFKQESKSDKELKSAFVQDGFRVTWTGNSLGQLNLGLVAQRSKPTVIGVVGPSGAGKTTFLGSLFNLLQSGKQIGNRRFAGSYTLLGWEFVAGPMQFHAPDEAHFPVHTTSGQERLQALLHLALKNDEKLEDILFTDVSGEWFVRWTENRKQKSAEGARWIFQHADAFLFFLDVKDLQGDGRGSAKNLVTQMALQMKDVLDERPVAIVLSKYDEYKKGKSKLLDKLVIALSSHFSKRKQFNVVAKNKQLDTRFHQNVLASVDWVVSATTREDFPISLPPVTPSSNYFLAYQSQMP